MEVDCVGTCCIERNILYWQWLRYLRVLYYYLLYWHLLMSDSAVLLVMYSDGVSWKLPVHCMVISWFTVGVLLTHCRGVKHPFSAHLPPCQQSWNISNLPRSGLFPIIDIIGNSLSYKSMLTRLESLLDKALRGIDLVRLPIIVAVIARLLALPVQLWVRYRVWRGRLCRSGCRKGVDCCAVLACYCIDSLILYWLAVVLASDGW